MELTALEEKFDHETYQKPTATVHWARQYLYMNIDAGILKNNLVIGVEPVSRRRSAAFGDRCS